MDPMGVLASQYGDGLARQRAAAGWHTRPSRVRSLLRRIGTLRRPARQPVVEPRRQRAPATSPIGRRRAYPRAQSG